MRFLVATSILLAAAAVLRAEIPSDITAEFYSDDGTFTDDQLVSYLFIYYEVDYGRTVNLDGSVDTAAIAKPLKAIREALGQEPYDATKIDPILDGLKKDAPLPFNVKVPPVTHELPLSSEKGAGTLGRIRLRKKPDDLRSHAEASGATLQFANDFLVEGDGAWNTEGAIILPLSFEWDNLDGPFLSSELSAGPAVYWKIIQSEGGGSADVEELQFSVPIAWSANTTSTAMPRVMTTLSPYYHTNWHFEGGTAGATLSLEPMFNFGNLAIGQWAALPGQGGESKLSETLAYRIRIAPKFDYGNVVSGGDHSLRPGGDEWFRAGALAEFGLQFFGKKKSPLELTASYEFLEGSGNDDFAELFTAKATKWFSNNQIGLSLEYQNGDTPITDKAVDMITLGLEVKF